MDDKIISIEERNLGIIEVIMLELGVSDIENLPSKVFELNKENKQLKSELTKKEQSVRYWERERNKFEQKVRKLQAYIDSKLQVYASAAWAAWISVDKRLPDSSGFYLVKTTNEHMGLTDENGIYKAYYDHLQKRFYGDAEITHWMHLPPPPPLLS